MHTKKYLSNLTALRGIAALLTVLFHIDIVLGTFGGHLVNAADSALMHRMYLMVDFFFVLSGFILCYVYAGQFENGVTRAGFKKFTVARFARVYPLHLISLFLTALLLFLLHQWGAVVSPVLDAENSVYSFITNLLLLHSMNLHKWFTFTHASWSISTEWWMYMLFPFLLRPVMKMSKVSRALLITLCIAGYFVIGWWLVPLVSMPDSLERFRVQRFSLNVAYQFGFFRCGIGFIIGMMVYQGYQRDWAKPFFKSGYTFLGLVTAVLLCMHFAVTDIITVLFFPCIILSAAYGNRRLDRILSSKPLQRLGDWSFALYLIHQPFLYQGVALLSNPGKTGITVPKMDLGTAWIVAAIFTGFILFMSFEVYRFIELPARTRINNKNK